MSTGPFVPEEVRLAWMRVLQRHAAGAVYRIVIFELIQAAGRYGVTDEMLEDLTGWPHQRVSARRRELVRDGKVCGSGRTRTTRSGREAHVWIAGTAPAAERANKASHPHDRAQCSECARLYERGLKDAAP